MLNYIKITTLVLPAPCFALESPLFVGILKAAFWALAELCIGFLPLNFVERASPASLRGRSEAIWGGNVFTHGGVLRRRRSHQRDSRYQ